MINCIPLYYDECGKPIDYMTWADKFERCNRHVADIIIGQYRVSTVFVGINMSIWPGSKPLIYETMIFGPPQSELDMWQDRYSDRESAIRGHEYACRLARGEIIEDGSEDVNNIWKSQLETFTSECLLEIRSANEQLSDHKKRSSPQETK